MIDGVRKTEHVDKAEVVDTFFDDLLGTEVDRPFSFDLDYLQLPTVDLSHMEVAFSKEEVWNAIRSMPLDKCPGERAWCPHVWFW